MHYKNISACGGELEALHGWFASPGYPNSYPVEIECVWTIKSSPGNTVMVDFRYFIKRVLA